MKLFKSKKVLVVLITVVMIGFFIAWFWYYHPTHYRYNDRFVIGNSINAITERYGEFDKIFYKHESENEISHGGYIVKPPEVGLWGTDPEKYYMIKFEDGKAVSVSIEEGGWGG